MPICYIGLGSNLGQSQQTLQSALAALAAQPAMQLLAQSRFYRSKPVGPADQPDYVNAVAQLATELPAQAVLTVLLDIERQQGRVRDAALRWGPRTLDLDLLLYGQAQIQTPTLTVPHPCLCERSFVVIPLLELDPDLILPNGQAVKDCPAATASDEALQPIL